MMLQGNVLATTLKEDWKDLIAYTMDPDAWASMKTSTTVTKCIELFEDKAFKMQIEGISKLLCLHYTFNNNFLDVINN